MSVTNNKDDCVKNKIERPSSLLDETKELGSCSDDVDFKATTGKISQYLLTGTICGGFLILGFFVTIYGLSLPTLAENMRLRIDEVSPSLATRGGGYLLGSILAGFVENKFNLQILVSVFLFLLALALALTPVILNPISMYIFSGLSAVGMGGYETLANVMALRLWGTNVEPVLQFLHFWAYFGFIVTPFIAKPFLNEVLHVNQSYEGSINETVFRDVKFVEGTSLPYVSIPYFIIAAFACTLILITLVLKFFTSIKLSDSKQKNTIANEGRKFRVTLLLFLFSFNVFYVGMNTTISSFLYTFASRDIPGMGYSKDVAANLTSIYSTSLIVAQLAAVFLSRKFAPTKMLIGNVTGIGVAIVLMLLLPFYANAVPGLFWVSVSIFGLFSASVYGTIFLWAERHITVNGRAASILVVGGAVGEMVFPLPVGILIEDNPHTYVYFNAAYAAGMALLFLVMVKFASMKGQRIGRKTTELQNLQQKEKETENES